MISYRDKSHVDFICQSELDRFEIDRSAYMYRRVMLMEVNQDSLEELDRQNMEDSQLHRGKDIINDYCIEKTRGYKTDLERSRRERFRRAVERSESYLLENGCEEEEVEQYIAELKDVWKYSFRPVHKAEQDIFAPLSENDIMKYSVESNLQTNISLVN